MGDQNERIAREKAFHDRRFAEPTERAQKVTRFYKIADSIRDRYWQFLKNNSAGAHVLEYGCGTGSYAFALAKHASHISGIDISKVALDQAKKRARKENVGDKIDFFLMNAEDLDYSDNTFDLVCGTGILHHLELEKALSEITRVLKPEGKAIFIEPLGHNLFINLYRSMTPEIRSEDEHPLLVSDLAKFQQSFRGVRFDYYYFTALVATLPGLRILLDPLENLDKQLFRWHFWRKQAWQVLIRLSV